MSEAKSIKKFPVWIKASNLTETIISFNDDLPEEELVDLKRRLSETVSCVTPAIEAGFKKTKRVEKLREWIRANVYLLECRDYLYMVEKFSFKKTEHLIEMIDELDDLLKDNYPATKAS